MLGIRRVVGIEWGDPVRAVTIETKLSHLVSWAIGVHVPVPDPGRYM